MNEPRKAPVVLSREEAARLLEAAPGLKYKAALSVAYGAGLRVSEVANLKVSDIDSERMTLPGSSRARGSGIATWYALSPQLLLNSCAELVAVGAAAGLALSRPEPDQSDHPRPAQSRCHRRQGSGGHLQARIAAHLAA